MKVLTTWHQYGNMYVRYCSKLLQAVTRTLYSSRCIKNHEHVAETQPIMSGEGNCSVDGVQSFVIFDTETTGLPFQQPKITELCFLAVKRSDLLIKETRIPRVINKLLLFADPGKPIEPEAAAITGKYIQHTFNHPLHRHKLAPRISYSVQFNTSVNEVCL